MQIKELIQRKRDGGEIEPADWEAIVSGYVRGDVQDYQIAALLMAVYFRGLALRELSALTKSMLESGKCLPRANRTDYWIDKHSTGGVGDKTSLLLVPLVTSVAQRSFRKHKVFIPMISGRGLGHSGGTLDKLEAVKGFSPNLSVERAMTLLKENCFFMMGQTADLAPADRLLYALRDVTATVESIPLIVSSIMSKKLSESLDGLVFDVKIGGGAFMETEGRARQLASTLLDVAKGHGVDSVAVLSRMDEPLGTAVGNFVEVEECADFLAGQPRDRGLEEVTLTLASWMVHLGSRRTISLANAEAECRVELSTDRPLGIFRRMFEAQGGSWTDFEKQRENFDQSVRSFCFRAPTGGTLQRVEAKPLGILLNQLGGGRGAKEDRIDPLVGIRCKKKVGDVVKSGEEILTVYHRPGPGVEALIQQTLNGAVKIASGTGAVSSWIAGIIQ